MVRTAFLTLLALSLAGCSSDSSNPSGSSSGGSSSGGSSSGGTGAGGSGGAATGGSQTGGASTGGTGGAAVVDACVGFESEYSAWVEGDPSLSDLAGDCGRVSCIAVLRDPRFKLCVGMCLSETIKDLPQVCLECVAITVETGASEACINSCLVEQDNCGPNEDLPCCDECLCAQGAYDTQAACSGIPTTTDCSVYE